MSLTKVTFLRPNLPNNYELSHSEKKNHWKQEYKKTFQKNDEICRDVKTQKECKQDRDGIN